MPTHSALWLTSWLHVLIQSLHLRMLHQLVVWTFHKTGSHNGPPNPKFRDTQPIASRYSPTYCSRRVCWNARLADWLVEVGRVPRDWIKVAVTWSYGRGLTKPPCIAHRNAMLVVIRELHVPPDCHCYRPVSSVPECGKTPPIERKDDSANCKQAVKGKQWS